MLVLSRKLGQRLTIGDDIVLTVVKIDATQVRIGIEAPRTVRILREELVSQLLAGPVATPGLARQDPAPRTRHVMPRIEGGTAMTAVEKLLEAIKDKPHSFSYLRRSVGMRLTDRQFVNLVKRNPGRFALVVFRRKGETAGSAQAVRRGVRKAV
jgi:carbon storage regulator